MSEAHQSAEEIVAAEGIQKWFHRGNRERELHVLRGIGRASCRERV